MQLSLKSRLIAALSTILLISFLMITILNYNTARLAIRNEITRSSLPLLRENIYTEIQHDFLHPLNISSMMATDSFLKEWSLEGEKDPEKVIQYLRGIQKRYGYKSAFFVSASTGRYYHYDGILKVISPDDAHDAWYYDFIKSGKEYVLDVDSDQAAKDRLTIFINYRLTGPSGMLLGVTGVGIVMEDFSRFLHESQEKYQRRIYLVDHEGLVQAHSNEAIVQKQNITREEGIREIADRILKTGEEPLNTHYEGPEGRVLITSRYIENIDWFLIVEQDEKSALASARVTLMRTVIIGVAASLLIILLSALTVNYYHRNLEALATTDSLTGCANRREMRRRLERMLYRKTRYGNKVSLIMIDIDRFKELNDTEGHQAGDQVLKDLTRIIGDGKRPDDLLARWGGDEFVVILEAGIDAARILAERIRYFFAQDWSERHPAGLRVTLSMGIAELNESEEIDSLIQRADKALYEAKRLGRDRIRTAK